MKRSALCLALAAITAPAVSAQVVDQPVLSLDAARSVAQAARSEAARQGLTVAVAIVDPSGGLILFERMDGVQNASLDIAIGKARTAARFRRPSKALDDAVSQNGRLGMLGIEGMLLMEGGLPVSIDGRVVAGVGVSGATGPQDAAVAAAGIAVLGM